MRKPPVAFFSYVRDDDQHDGGRLTRIRERLQREIAMQCGYTVEIFQDRNEKWGSAWDQRIVQALDATAFLIPVITPRFFNSGWCRKELRIFAEREKNLGKNNLILSLYYQRVPMLHDEAKRAGDPLAQLIASRNWEDWRELRGEAETSPAILKAIIKAAEAICEALDDDIVHSGWTNAAQPLDAATDAKPATAPEPNKFEQSQPVNDPHTIIVDWLGHGNYPTISEAIDAASAGSRILVRPGVYREELKIDKVVEIIGDGKRDDIVVEGCGCSVISFKATLGRIVNLSLYQRGEGKHYSVIIASGRLEICDCQISSDSLACIAIYNGADPVIRRNRISDGRSSGIVIFGASRGIIEDNEITGNSLSGIEIKEGSDPVIRRNCISNSRQSGVWVHADGRGTIEDNEIIANDLPGISIGKDAEPVIRRNRISNGRQSGIHVLVNGGGIIEYNDIIGNRLAGVTIKYGANPVLRFNRIHNNKQSGISIFDGGRGDIQDNEICDNSNSGLVVYKSGRLTVRKNTICDNENYGVLILQSAVGICEGNSIKQNGKGAKYLPLELGADFIWRRNVEE